MSKPTSAPDHLDERHGADATMPSSSASTSRLPPPLSRDTQDSRPHTLAAFQQQEGSEQRKRRLQQIWGSLANSPVSSTQHVPDAAPEQHQQALTPEKAKSLKDMYDDELVGLCKSDPSTSRPSRITWDEFQRYADAKEVELWHIFHDELDLDGNGHLDPGELQTALKKAGIEIDPDTLSDFMSALSQDSEAAHAGQVTFSSFRDFLILLPRKVSATEIFRFYKVKRYLGDDGRGAARVNMEGDVSLSAEDKPPPPPPHKAAPHAEGFHLPQNNRTYDWDEEDEDFYDDDEIEDHQVLEGHTALKFLFAGGIAGAVSRTATAPFDRLKVFLITRPPELGGAVAVAKQPGFKLLASAVARIYTEGGALAFWTGNGLSVAKIFPESAIKFFAYESSKRAFAKYWDKVEDTRDISGVSRFLSGGIGGLTSQLTIYPMETLKTQMMSNAGQQRRSMLDAFRTVYSLNGFRGLYRGLTIGLIGVFPYSAIDMSTFEALKIAYCRSTGKNEPGVLELLAFGSVSGSVGAASVYPLNLVRTRYQASGSPGHPQHYTGIMDVAVKTWEAGGWRGFYRGLFPTLAKVVPAVSISYVVYEHTKRRLGV
ncbi:mitochondrial carrier [Ephemerocybe angulata]|uniref:Mitochondrial carrier n=1 Tax=Ephemerocybe angulata TaxID=980116 RepID=A0A8H6ID49_9AGAR|nr:mitochondrial carrier [Tulosesus angulatus]